MNYLAIATEKRIYTRSLIISLIVGSLLTLINQYNKLFESGLFDLNYLKVGLTFVVPYLVSTYSSIKATLSFSPGQLSIHDVSLKCTCCNDSEVHLKKGDLIPVCSTCINNTKWGIHSKTPKIIGLGNKSNFVVNNPSPVFRVDAEGNILDKNPAAKDVISSDIYNIFESFFAFHQLNLQEVIEANKTESIIQSIGDKTYQFEIRGLSKDKVCQVYGSDITEFYLVEELDNSRQSGNSAFNVRSTCDMGVYVKCQQCNSSEVFLRTGEIIPECANCKENTKWQSNLGSEDISNKNDKSNFVDYNPSPVLRIDATGLILDKNPAAQNVLGDNILNVLSDLDGFSSLDLNNIIATQQKLNLVQSIGENIFQFEIIGIKEDAVCQVYGSDITALNYAQHELQALARFPKLNPSPVIRFDKQGLISSSNTAANTLFELETIEGKNIVDLFESVTLESIIECIDESHNTNHIEKIGSKTFKVNVRGISDLSSCQIYATDITEIESSKEKLHSYALFAKLNPEPVMRFDYKGTIIDANPAAKKALISEELIGDNIKAHVTAFEEIDIQNCIDNNAIFIIEDESQEKVYRYIVRGIAELNVCHMYGTDVTERVKAENTVKKYSANIKSSINAAKRIQHAALPSDLQMNQLLPDNFVVYQPKDVVSGDYYWLSEKNNKVIFAAADSTGHGVPGGFMSMLGISNLNQIIAEDTYNTAADILSQLRTNIKNTLGQEAGAELREGMDMVICIYDKSKKTIEYAGAYNPLLLVRNKEVIKYAGDKMPVGIHHREDPFTNHIIDIQNGDTVYLYSDGYQDQFGGEHNKKFSPKRLRQLLLEINTFPMQRQKEEILNAFNEWKKDTPQIDDVVLMGVRF